MRRVAGRGGVGISLSVLDDGSLMVANLPAFFCLVALILLEALLQHAQDVPSVVAAPEAPTYQ